MGLKSSCLNYPMAMWWKASGCSTNMATVYVSPPRWDAVWDADSVPLLWTDWNGI